MPDIFDINFNQQASDLSSPDKRQPSTLSLIRALLTPLQWARDLILGTYKKGTGVNIPAYSPGTYNKFDQVVFKKSLFYSLVDNNSSSPTDSSSWQLIQSNFIGVDERVKFNGQSLVLEYALNERFAGNFRPPPSTSHSDIYFANVAAVPYGFRIGRTIGSTIGQTTSSDFIGYSRTFLQVVNFNVYVLASIFALTSEKEIRGFIDLYLPIGLNYNVIPY